VVLSRPSSAPRSPPPLAVAAPALTVREPYVREVPPGATVTAAFLTLANPGTSARAVVAATSPAAQVVELHAHLDEGGVMRMRRVARLEVPAGGTTVLAPGGYHLMLIDLVRPLAAGEVVPIELVLDDGARVRLDAPVRAAAAAGAHAQVGRHR